MSNFNDKQQNQKPADADQNKSTSTIKQPAPAFAEKTGQTSPRTDPGKQAAPKEVGSMHDAKQGTSTKPKQ
ncbi:hypothetical protein [Aquitalea sp. ASV15]|uniref:hypothetical protein n=1 Tax=Aquitalea sp. ASV15 TaxID=2795104 RepID=UPI0018EBBDFC|nr:hypothetical protein [Aquitalea sp. ASV15]